MDKYEAALAVLADGSIKVDAERGIVYGKRGEPIGSDNGRGWLKVGFCHNGQNFNMKLHNLIYLSVHGSIPQGKEVDHADRNKRNNSIHNLQAVSHSANMRNREHPKTPRVLTEEDVQAIRWLYANTDMTQPQLAARFSVTTCYISMIVNRRRWPEVPDVEFGSDYISRYLETHALPSLSA